MNRPLTPKSAGQGVEVRFFKQGANTLNQALLLTGAPGTGKTTIIREAITASKAKAGGFYTQEIRQGGVRQGFEIVTLDGSRAVLAHVDIRGSQRVGKYGVDVVSLDRVAVPAMRQAIRECDIVVVDEIGKMELLSPAFREILLEALNSTKRLLGTVMLQPHPFADQIKHDPRVEVLLVSKANRDQDFNKVTDWLGA
jgi:nucleoside-triphosphatase